MVPLTERPAPELLTARLRLPLVTPEDAAGMLAGRRRVSWLPGYPAPADLDLATLVPSEPDEPDGWGPRHVVRRGDGATVGCAALVGPPEAGDDGVGEVEAVVRLVDDARGRGAGREALAGLLAEADRLGVRVRAAISPDDPAAMRFATRNGFTGLRGARDDGALVMVRPLPGTTAVASSPAARPTRRTGARPMTPRLVATDLDGTLLRSDRTVSPRTAATLERAHESGLPVVFVTGRPLRWAAEVFDHVGRHGLVIAANGALVWDVSTDGPRLERTIAADDVDHVTAAVRAEFPGAAFAVERLDGFVVEDHEAYRPQHELAPDVRRRPLAELVAAPVQKLLVRNPGHLADDYAPRVQELAGDRVEVTFSNGDDLLEVSAAGVTKASTLALLCEELGVQPGEVVALGDMPNDVAMLRWAGTSYAMADAHPLAVEAATHRALSNDDDGVAVVIEGLLGAQ